MAAAVAAASPGGAAAKRERERELAMSAWHKTDLWFYDPHLCSISLLPLFCCTFCLLLVALFFPPCWLLGAVVFPFPPSPFPKPTHPQEAVPFSPSKFISLYLLFVALHFSDSLCACWWCLVFFCCSAFLFLWWWSCFFFLLFVCLWLQCKFSLTFGVGFYLSFSSEVVSESRSPAEFWAEGLGCVEEVVSGRAA